jgi:hypothetical protein
VQFADQSADLRVDMPGADAQITALVHPDDGAIRAGARFGIDNGLEFHVQNSLFVFSVCAHESK